jgi:hypothetical protein
MSPERFASEAVCEASARRVKGHQMRSWIGYALAVVAALGALLGLFLIVAAGGNESESIRAGGVELLVVAVVAAIAAVLVLRRK